MTNVDNRFQPDKLKYATRKPDGDLFPQPGPPPIKGVTRENFATRLVVEKCPKCGITGCFNSFPSGPHLGIVCLACGREHPFRGRGLMWLPGQDAAWKRGT